MAGKPSFRDASRFLNIQWGRIKLKLSYKLFRRNTKDFMNMGMHSMVVLSE